MRYRDYYKVLGVSRDASQDEIRKAYRRLARRYHPDVSKEADAGSRFREVGEAYEVLKDPEKRAAYDRLGRNWKAGQDFRPPPDWNEIFGFPGGGFGESGSGRFSDFFEVLFGGGFGGDRASRRRPVRRRGEDHRARIAIDVEDAYRGGIRTLTLRAGGPDEGGPPRSRERTLKVRIPRGVRQGQRIRLAGQGGPGAGPGSQAGDLYLEVEFRPNRLYRVDGSDVYLDVPIAPWEAALGSTIRVPTPSGPVTLKVPAGSPPGRRLRLKGRGIPAATPGDLYAVLQIALPPADSPERRRAYERMKQDLDFNPRAGLGV